MKRRIWHPSKLRNLIKSQSNSSVEGCRQTKVRNISYTYRGILAGRKMSNQQQDRRQVGDEILPGSFRGTGRSNPIAVVDSESLSPLHVEHDDRNLVAEGSGWRKLLSYVGPGFLVSMAYLDPNNLETDLQAGASNGYQLLWVILIGLIFALIIQSVAANLGVITGKHLAEMCKAEYPKLVNFFLWLLAEIAVIGADIPEVIGTSFALNILFHIPLWAGVIMTGFSSLLLLGVQRYGERKLELLIALLISILAACFFGELSYVKPPASEVLKGLFIPKLSGNGATANAIALIGSNVMPHNLFLHSALVLSRKVPNTVDGINDARRYFVMELSFTMFLALVINVSITSVSSAVCSPNNISPEIRDQCNNLTAKSASFLLKNVLGKSSSIVYGIALLASGQSATITSTYAGQYIMQGFWNIRMKQWARNLMTRSMAIVPSLVVTIISGSSGAGRLIIVTSIVLSIELPFALIPLLKFTSSSKKMGPHKSSIYTIVLSWVLGLLVIGINVYYLVSTFVGWLLHNKLPQVGKVFIGIIVFPIMGVYVVAVIYLAFRKDTLFNYSEPEKNDSIDQFSCIEREQGKSDEALEIDQATHGTMT